MLESSASYVPFKIRCEAYTVRLPKWQSVFLFYNVSKYSFTPYSLFHSIQVGLWIRFYANNTEMEAWYVPQVQLNCNARISGIPNCEIQFDHPEDQCAEGRRG